MATTINQTVLPADGWVRVIGNPDALTIHVNPRRRAFSLAITATDVEPAPGFTGEVHDGESSWIAGAITGFVWVRAREYPVNFAFTIEGEDVLLPFIFANGEMGGIYEVEAEQ